MEFEQIIKRIDWLEKQQREKKDSLAELNERLNSFEATINIVSKQIKILENQLTELTPVSRRVDQYETIVNKQRQELLHLIGENDRHHTRAEQEIAKQHLPELERINKALAQLKNGNATNIKEIKRQIKERADEIQRITNNVNDFKSQVDQANRSNEDAIHAVKALEETRKNDLKNITDIQGELGAMRKRVEENRDRHTLISDNMRNVESRLRDLIASELERKQAQTAFLEQQLVAQLDRDRAWKEWIEKVEIFQKEASSLDGHIQRLDDALRGAKRAQDTYLELNTKLERRISEITEMQRLAEERLRQEWISFKVDDQKRWTGYSLSNEESFREVRKELQKASERITPLQDVTQVLQDQMHQITDTTEKELQEAMNVLHEWMTSYQRIMGHGRKTNK